jgi:zinc finger RNA-binding protein
MLFVMNGIYQAYKLHLEGKTHKKKEAAIAVGTKTVPTGPQAPIASSKSRVAYCTICDVACSSQDAYAAHIRGAKHQKVSGLHYIAAVS